MAKPMTPTDVMVVNGWYLDLSEISDIGIDALFQTLEGVGRSNGTVEVVDAGTNKKLKFSDQIIDFSEMTLTRTYQNNKIDKAMQDLISEMLSTGLKLDEVIAVKMHNGVQVMRYLFTGFRFSSEENPAFDTEGTEKFTVSYKATCDDYVQLPY